MCISMEVERKVHTLQARSYITMDSPPQHRPTYEPLSSKTLSNTSAKSIKTPLLDQLLELFQSNGVNPIILHKSPHHHSHIHLFSLSYLTSRSQPLAHSPPQALIPTLHPASNTHKYSSIFGFPNHTVHNQSANPRYPAIRTTTSRRCYFRFTITVKRV